MTKAEIIVKLARKLAAKRRKELTWADFVNSAASMIPADKAAVIMAVRAGKAKDVGRILTSAAVAYAAQQATTEATSMLADDALDITELERLL